MGVITFNGVSSESLGIKVWTFPQYEVPEKEIQMIHIPGRNGDIVVDHDSYKNVERSYQLSFYDKTKTYVELANTVSKWLHSANGYAILEDTYEPDYYRMACYHEENTYSNVLNQAVTCSITFSCKPQRYLKSGAQAVTISGTGTITNPEMQISNPEITINLSGNGTVVIGDTTITVDRKTTGATKIIVDSEMQDVYYMSGQTIKNGNSLVSFTNRKFPTLNSGTTTIRTTGGVSSVEVKPKWWTL